MKAAIQGPFLLVLGISLALIACNQQGQKGEQATTDTTQEDTMQPAGTETMPDGVQAAPDLYKVLNDSMGIRIVEAAYKPGDSSAMHSHHDNVVYMDVGGTATFYDKDGSKMENTLPTGTSMVRAAEVHSVKNTGKAPLRAILVEVNRPIKAMSFDTSLDATKVAPSQYKLVKDTLGLRVIEVNFKPGQTAGMHSHPDAALYVVEGSTAEFTGKDDSKRVLELKKGMTLVVPADTHSVKNTGKTTMKGILVEVKRAMN